MDQGCVDLILVLILSIEPYLHILSIYTIWHWLAQIKEEATARFPQIHEANPGGWMSGMEQSLCWHYSPRVMLHLKQICSGEDLSVVQDDNLARSTGRMAEWNIK